MLDSILTFGEDELVEGLKAFIEAIVNENVSLVISRQLLSEVHNLTCVLAEFSLNLISCATYQHGYIFIGWEHTDPAGGFCVQSCLALHSRGRSAQSDQF